MLKDLLWITAAVACTGLMAPPAYADDAYVCDGGRLVYARPETLEKLKQTDPCIQGYFGVLPASPAPANLTPASEPFRPAAPAAPNRTARDKAPNARQPAPLKGTTRDAGLALPRPKPAQAKSPQASPDTDFRNVRVINAPAPETSVYRHDR